MLQKILSESKFIPKKDTLEDFVFARLQKRIQVRTRLTLGLYLVMGAASSISLYMYAGHLFTELHTSGVYDYFRLIVSEDLGTLTLVSKEIFYALFESLPMMSLTLSLGLLFMVMVSVNGIMTSLRKGFLYKNYI